MFAVGHDEAEANESPSVKRSEEDGVDLQDIVAEAGRYPDRCKEEKDRDEEGQADSQWRCPGGTNELVVRP